MTTPNMLDEKYIVNAQDVAEPIWETDSNIAGMQNTDDPDDLYQESTPMVRVASGAIEFLNDIAEDMQTFLEMDVPNPVAKAPKLDAIRTRELGSDKWRGGSKAITSQTSNATIARSPFRRQVTLVNYGPSIVYISSVPSAAGAPNTYPIPVSGPAFWAPVVLQTRDDIYAYSVAATVATLSTLEEFDQES